MKPEWRSTALMGLLFIFALGACGQEAETGAEPDTEQASPAAEEASPEPEGPGPECVETSELTAIDSAPPNAPPHYEFDPSCIVTSDTAVTVRNEDDTIHSLTIPPGTETDVDIQAGKTEKIDIEGAAEPIGETYFVCKYHRGMDGFLWVK